MTTAAAAKKKPFPPGMPIGPGHVIAGKYRVDELVAIGGMGIVVAAQHLQLGQKVAIKVLLPSEMSDESQAIPRFLREARAAAGIRSENVVRIYDVDTFGDGVPYMVMELLDGIDLRRVVKTHGSLEVGQAVDFVLQAADAIEEAHRLGIVHRDIKPSNLFLTRRKDGRPLVKVLDFGISKASQDPVDGALTTSRAMIGSPMYMSPEQVRDAKSVDGRSDIWSLGVILYELLAGKPAFKGDSLPAICAAIAADPPPALREIRPDVPVELEDVILTCLAKSPNDRYATVADLSEALAPFMSHDMPYLPTMPAPSGTAVGFVLPASGPMPRSFRPQLPSQPQATTRPNPLRARAIQGVLHSDPADPASASTHLASSQPGSLRLAASSPASTSNPLSRGTPASRAGYVTGSTSPRPPSPADSSESLPTARYDSQSPPSMTGPRSMTGPQSMTGSVQNMYTNTGPGVSDSPFTGTMTSPGGKSRLGLVIVAIVLGVSLIVAAVVLVMKQKTPDAAAVAPKPKQFTLHVESAPAGAEVVENERVLGKTPLDLQIDRESVAQKPRELVLRLEGYKPRTIRQGPSDSDLTIQPELQPDGSAGVESASASPKERTPPVGARFPRQPAPKPSAKPPTSTPGTDIKLHR